MNTVSHSTRSCPPSRAWLIILVIFALLCGLLAGATMAILPRDQQIARGVTIDSVPLGGLTRADAEDALREVVSSVTDQSLTLHAGDDTLQVTLQELGTRPDVEAAIDAAMAVGRHSALPERVRSAAQARWRGLTLPLAYAVDDARIEELLTVFAARINTPPVEASAHWDGSRVVISPGRVGAKLDLPASINVIKTTVQAALERKAPVPASLTLVYRAKTPRVPRETLAAIDTRLGEFSTSYATSSRNRASNIDTASAAINGKILLPGEVFSFNDIVGPRTRATGYRDAPVIVNGQMDTGIGGGICQVSTTLYNAVLLANLGIVRRNHHSLPSHYVKPGMDATVSYGTLDFQFRNTSHAPVVIEMTSVGRRLIARILGEGPAPQVRIERSGITRLPGRTITKKDPALPKGKRVVERGGGGLAVTVTRIVGSGPEAVHEVVSRDRYAGEPTVIRVGTGPEEASGPKKPPTTGESASRVPASPNEGTLAPQTDE